MNELMKQLVLELNINYAADLKEQLKIVAMLYEKAYHDMEAEKLDCLLSCYGKELTNECNKS